MIMILPQGIRVAKNFIALHEFEEFYLFPIKMPAHAVGIIDAIYKLI